MGNDNSIVVTDWLNKRTVASNKADPAIVNSVTCSFDSNALQILTVGDKFMKFWTISGRNMVGSKISTMSKNKKLKNMTKIQMYYSSVSFKDCYAVGCADGNIYIFKQGSKDIESIITHYTPTGSGSGGGGKKREPTQVNALCVDDSCDLLLSGGKDGKIKFWSTTNTANITNTKTIDITSLDLSGVKLNAKIITALAHRIDGDGGRFITVGKCSVV